MNEKDVLFAELLNNQLKLVPLNFRLQYDDIKRISKYINSSIFNENTCCIWSGYITNSKSENKGTYINFYFRKKKVALHRLLYVNYIGVLNKDEYLKFTCENKGKCCNIYHMNKFKYQHQNTPVLKEKIQKVIKNKAITIHCVDDVDNINDDKLIISFD